MLGHGIEIPIIVQERVAFLNAECANDYVDGLAHCDTAFPQQAIIAGCPNGEAVVKHRTDRELAQIRFDGGCMTVIARALEDLHKNKIANKNLQRIFDILQTPSSGVFYPT